MGRELRFPLHDHHFSRFTADGIRGDQGAVGIDKETGSTKKPVFVGGLDLHHGPAVPFKHCLGLIGQGMDQIDRLGGY